MKITSHGHVYRTDRYFSDSRLHNAIYWTCAVIIVTCAIYVGASL